MTNNEYLEEALDNLEDGELKKVLAAALFTAQKRNGTITEEGTPLSAVEIAQIADSIVTSMGISRKVTKNAMDPRKAGEYLADHAAAQTGTAIKLNCKQTGTLAGAVVGGWGLAFAGPIGVVIGAVLGGGVLGWAGGYVDNIMPGIKKVAEIAVKTVKAAWNVTKVVGSALWAAGKAASPYVQRAGAALWEVGKSVCGKLTEGIKSWRQQKHPAPFLEPQKTNTETNKSTIYL